MEQWRKKTYVGVYGIFITGGKILMIKKNRGPYVGLLDLPGGGINFQEKVEDALRRELKEETGAELIQYDFFHVGEYSCRYTENGVLKDFHHIALYYLVNLKVDNMKQCPDGQDSDGSIFIPISLINEMEIAPIARVVLREYVDKIK